MTDDDQLALDVVRATDRKHSCCGTPAAPLDATDAERLDFPHADDCPNPAIGTWLDKWGRPMRRLWCSDDARKGGPCPHGGQPRLGPCCKDMATT